MTCHGIRPNVRHIEILHLVSVLTGYRSRHVILHQSAKSYPNRTTISIKNDVMSILRIAYLSHLGFQGYVMSSLKRSCTTCYRSSIETIALNCLVFEKIAFFCILASRSKMADLRHLGFYGSNNGFFENSMYVFLQVADRHHSCKLLSLLQRWEVVRELVR